jgi:hypothetical protein
VQRVSLTGIGSRKKCQHGTLLIGHQASLRGLGGLMEELGLRAQTGGQSTW